MEKLSKKIFNIIEKMKSFVREEEINNLKAYDEVEEKVKNFYHKYIEGVNKSEEIQLVNALKNINRSSEFSFFASILLLTFFDDNNTFYNFTPPLEAHEYVGNNKLKIKHSTRAYGLLFD